MKKIISIFVKEQKRYSKREIRKILELGIEEIDGFIKKLKAFGVLKSVANNSIQRELSDLIDEDIEITEVESDEYLYVFTYVGVINIGNRVIKCYPKYITKSENLIDDMKQILKVIRKYGSKEQIINVFNGDRNEKTFNTLAATIFFINDFYEYGVYTNTEDVVEYNGDGEILWDKSINENFPLIYNGRPYYTELFTKKIIDDEFDFFKRLHECILTRCCRQFEEAGLLELFDIEAIDISEEDICNFGEKEYILYRLQIELDVQYNTRKQILLKTLYSYIENEKMTQGNSEISMYGTNSFNLIWESVCADVFNNKLNTTLAQINLPKVLLEEYNCDSKLIDIIERPTWIGKAIEGLEFEKKSKDTLKPDLISVEKYEEKVNFNILDAKYYNIELEEGKKLRNYPGIGDITKQYLYELAYKKFIEDHNIEKVNNCFLFPIEGDQVVKKGFVKMDMFGSMGLKDIEIILLPVKMMYEKYLTKKVIEFSKLNL